MTNATEQFILAHPDDAPESIRSALSSMPVTARAIPLKGLTALLRLASLEEVLPQYLIRAEIPIEAREGLSAFLRHVNDLRQDYLDTTDVRIATTVSGVLGALADYKAITPDGVSAIYALGGGLLYDVPTEAEIADVRTLAALAPQLASAGLRLGNAYRAAAALIAAQESKLAAGDVSATVPSDDELIKAIAQGLK